MQFTVYLDVHTNWQDANATKLVIVFVFFCSRRNSSALKYILQSFVDERYAHGLCI